MRGSRSGGIIFCSLDLGSLELQKIIPPDLESILRKFEPAKSLLIMDFDELPRNKQRVQEFREYLQYYCPQPSCSSFIHSFFGSVFLPVELGYIQIPTSRSHPSKNGKWKTRVEFHSVKKWCRNGGN